MDINNIGMIIMIIAFVNSKDGEGMKKLEKDWRNAEPGIVGVLFGLEIAILILTFNKMIEGLPSLFEYVLFIIVFILVVFLMITQYPVMKDQFKKQLHPNRRSLGRTEKQ